MTSSAPNVKAGVTTPAAPSAKPVKKGGSSKMLILIIVVVLLLCCCTTSAAAGGYLLYKNNKDKEETTTTEKTTKKNTEKTTEKTTSVKEAEPPTAGEVKDLYMDLDGYRYTAEIYYDSSKQTLSGEFLFPNSEYLVTDEDMAVTEEITIEGTHYLRAQGGEWAETDDPYNAMFAHDEILLFFDGIKSSEQAIDNGQYWEFTYTDEDYGDEWTMLVDKDTNLPYQLYSSYENNSGEQVEETFTFSEYNDDTISIEAPI